MARSSSQLTDSQRSLLRSALGAGDATSNITSSQRQAIRDICSAMRDRAHLPESLLIAFKAALSDAADDAKIPLGTERNTLADRLVSVFIEELYLTDAARRTNDDEVSAA